MGVEKLPLKLSFDPQENDGDGDSVKDGMIESKP